MMSEKNFDGECKYDFQKYEFIKNKTTLKQKMGIGNLKTEMDFMGGMFVYCTHEKKPNAWFRFWHRFLLGIKWKDCDFN